MENVFKSTQGTPTGRLSRSEPEIQHLPGTARYNALSRIRHEQRMAADKLSFVNTDFSKLEYRALGL